MSGETCSALVRRTTRGRRSLFPVTVDGRADEMVAVLAILLRMPMRTECKNFESRTYPNGDTVRKCNLDLAPDAPWRCPENCPKFERRLADVAWTHGSLVVPPTPPEPAGLDDGTAAALLDEAEDILNAAGARIQAEVQSERAASARGKRLWRFFRRKRG